MKKLRLFIAVALLSGCAFSTDRIDLSYSPDVGVAPPKEADNVVIGLNVYDDRQDKSNKVSSKKNGFGIETAPILANEDINVTFRKAIDLELRARGFKIHDQAIVFVDVNLIKFWNDFKLGVFAGDSIAELNMSITVKDKAGKIYYSKVIIAQGIEPNIQLMTGDNAKLALDRALENGIRQLFADKVFFQRLLEGTNQGKKAGS